MQLTLTITLDNDAFQDSGEVARILRALAERYADQPDQELENPIKLRDYNGNVVGRVTVSAA